MPWCQLPDEELEFKTDGKTAVRTYQESLAEAMDLLLSKDERVFVIGEGVDDPGGIFGTTKGLKEKYGDKRVLDSPLSENSITSMAAGAGMMGLRPIVVHLRMDFLTLAMDPIINHAAKWRYMTDGKLGMPMVVRTMVGRGWGSASQHSQALHAMFSHIPGLRVLMPSSPADAKNMLIAAVNCEDPVIFVEHRWLYNKKGPVPIGSFEVDIDKGVVRRHGTDVTIVAFSYACVEMLSIAEELEANGVSAEIIDPRSAFPLDLDIISDSVKKTGRLVVADIGGPVCGIASEIISSVCERDISILKTNPLKITPPHVPVPAALELEEEFYPSPDTMKKKIIEMVKKG